MVRIELVPDLSHCVETIAKRKFSDLVKQLLTSGGNKELQEKLETLRFFLERSDFRKPRTESEKQLIEGKVVQFVVYLEEGIPKYEMQVK